MSFPSAEQRANAQAFDYMVSSADAALRLPEIAAQLGPLAADLLAINDTAFLPNFREGRFVLPREQEDTSNVAIVPLTDEQATNVYSLNLDESLQSKIVHSWSSRQELFTGSYDFSIEESALRTLFISTLEHQNSAPTDDGLRPHVFARTMSQICFAAEEYSTKRPIIVTRPVVAKEGPLACAAIVTHELSHARDMLKDGALYASPEYAASSELQGYFVSKAHLNLADFPSIIRENTDAVESFRQKAKLGEEEHPFSSNPWIVGRLKKMGVLR